MYWRVVNWSLKNIHNLKRYLPPYNGPAVDKGSVCVHRDSQVIWVTDDCIGRVAHICAPKKAHRHLTVGRVTNGGAPLLAL